MGTEALKILTVSNPESEQHSQNILFSQRENHEIPCTAKTTFYCASIAAGIMISQFAKYLRHIPVDKDIQLNILTMELALEN